MIDAISRAAYGESLAATIEQAFAPWSRMPPHEWAEEIYRLPGGHRFRWDFAPYTRRMFDSLFDRSTIETAFELYSRGLKSTVVLLAIGYTIDQAPRRILSLWPTNSQAEKWSKDNLCGELLNSTPCLNFLGNDTGRRIASNTLLHKAFPGGLIEMFGANAPGDMRRAKGSFLYADEIDAIGSKQTDEGDQLVIFNKRGDEYPDTIRVFASYPSVLGASRIHSRIEESDWNEWHSTCPKCGGEPFVMKRGMIQYEPDKPEGARLICPRCEAQLDDGDRYAMAHRQGFDRWKPRKEFRGKRGFQANAMLWPHPVDTVKFPGGWLQCLAQAEIDAKKSDNPKRSLRVLINTVDAEPFDPTDESEKPPEWQTIYAKREAYGLIVPQPALFLTAFVDCQLNRLEVGWRAWGRDDESWGLDHVVLDGHVRDAEVWKALTHELQRKWIHVSGAPMRLGMCLVDGGHYAEDVYRYMQDLAARPVEGVTGHCRASKGIGQHGHPIIDRKWRTVAKLLKGYHIGTWEAKDRIYERLKMEPGEGVPAIHFNERYSEEYFQQLTSEIVSITYEKGQVVRKYLNPGQARNEALDIEVGNLAAWRLHPRNLDALETQIEEAAKEATGKAEPRKPAAMVVRGGGWNL